MDPGATIHKIGNKGTGMDKPDVATSLSDTDLNAAIPQISNSLDDLRRLGEIDLQLNHPGATAVEKVKDDANR